MNLIFNAGELFVDENTLKYKIKSSNLNYTDIDTIANNYKNIINKNYLLSDYFINIQDIEQKSHYVTFFYNANGYKNFYKMRDINFKDKVYMYNDLIELAKFSEKENINIFWEATNFYIDVEDHNIKGLIFEFDPLTIKRNNNALEGLKDMIFHTLTVVEKRLGKPRYDDFIEKDNYIIEYVEKLISAKNISEIETLTLETIQTLEHNEEKERQELIEKKENRKIKIPQINKKEIDPKEEKRKRIKKHLLSSNPSFNQEAGSSSFENHQPFFKKLYSFLQSTAGIAVMGGAFVLLIFLYLATDGFAMENGEETEDENLVAEELEQEISIKDIYRNYIYGNEEEAREMLTGLEYEELKEEDQELYLEFLIEDEYYTRALSLSDRSAYYIGKQLNEDNITDIERMAEGENNDQLNFYIAMYNQNFQNAIEHSNELEIIDEQTALDITKAYFLTNQEEEYQEYLESISPDNEEATEQENSNYQNLSQAYATFNNEYINYNNTRQQLDSVESEISTLEADDDLSDDQESRLENLQAQQENLAAQEEEEYNELLNMNADNTSDNYLNSDNDNEGNGNNSNDNNGNNN